MTHPVAGRASAAGILRLLDAGTIPGSATPISTIDKLLAEQPAQAPLEQTVTRLLEFLDLAISPSILVKVGIRRDLELAVRPGDLIQLLGHMLLYAAEFTGERGEKAFEALVKAGEKFESQARGAIDTNTDLIKDRINSATEVVDQGIGTVGDVVDTRIKQALTRLGYRRKAA